MLAYAVPPGAYYDSRGRNRAIVTNDGKTIYIMDRNGNTTHELTVTEENSDGSFATKDERTGFQHSAYKNAWFTDRNGNVCLNVEWLRETVTRQ